MPLLWKTVKNASISQLVNDHLHRSRKRRDGSSLFVETGFPTSLVDLFIKNRDKLKKPSKKNRRTAPTADFTDPVIPDTPTVPFNSPAISPLVTGSPSRSPSISPALIETAGSVDGSVEREVVHETGVVDASTVLMVVLIMFLVVVLALGTKRLTVGITISAFLLFFLEFVGKHARAVLKPFSEVNGFLKSRVQCVLRLLRFKEDFVPKIEQECLSKNDQEVLIRGVGCEIQPVDEIKQDQVFYDLTGYRKTEPEEVSVIGEEESNLLKRKSRRAKIKSKIKKLVPKKLRCSRKEHISKKVEIGGEEEVEEDNSSILFQYEDERGSDNGRSVLSSSASWRYKEEENNNKTPDLGELSESVTKMEGKSEGIDNWRYLVPCMIVLAGLIGGRAFAVILTLSWFLMLKVGDKLQRGVLKIKI